MSGARKDVSCLALSFFYGHLEKRGISRRALQEGLPYPPSHLDSRLEWIDLDTFSRMERRMAELCPQPDLFFEMGRGFTENRGFGFLLVMARTVFSPYQFYRLLPWMVHYLFPFVSVGIERLSPRAFRATYRFREGYAPSDAFLETVRGILTGTPNLVGLPEARVSGRRSAPLIATFDIQLARPVDWKERLSTAGRRVKKTASLWARNWTEATSELEETNRLLREKVDALSETQAELRNRVRDLSLLHSLSRAGGDERDPEALCQRQMVVLSEALGRVPSGILLGEPREAETLTCSVRLSDEARAHLLASEEFRSALTSPGTEVATGDGAFHVLPLRYRNHAVGVWVVGRTEMAERPFLEVIAAELSVILDNALAFQTIDDLRKHLESRVRSRTLELDAANAQLEQTVRRLRHSDRARNAFFTNLSHELRTPLTLILAPLDDLEARLSDAHPSGAEDVRMVRHNARMLLREIDEILAFARTDADRPPLRPEPFELTQLASEVLSSVRPLADRRHVALESDFAAPLEVELDRVLIRRVLLNLLNNAVKYVREGDRIRLSAREETRESGPRIVMEVADTGPGIPPDQQARIFERFGRAERPGGEPVKGSGIGLALVRELVALQEGTLVLRSDPGQGATFTVELPPRLSGEPLAWPNVELLEPPVEPARVDAPSPSPLREGCARVLLVEDNAQMRALLARLLAGRFRVSVAKDGIEGLERARADPPDAILADVMMPGMDGYALCRALMADPSTHGIPVLLVSARQGTQAALEGFQAGAADYIVKPFSAPELIARVDAQTRLRAMMVALARSEKQAALGLMSAGIAHEVLNPINAVINAVGPLREILAGASSGRERGVMLLDVVARGGERVRRIVQALLSFARQDEQLHPRDVAPSEVIDSVLALLEFRIGERVHIHREDAEADEVACVPELLSQVVMNLLTNALDALPPEGGNIWIGARREGETVRITLRDDGPGVSPKLRERIFDAFFTTKPPGAGTGLGLALSRELMALQGGSLELLASDGPGARFEIRLPRASPSSPDAGRAEVIH